MAGEPFPPSSVILPLSTAITPNLLGDSRRGLVAFTAGATRNRSEERAPFPRCSLEGKAVGREVRRSLDQVTMAQSSIC